MFSLNPYLLLGFRYFLHSRSRVLGGELLVAGVAEWWFCLGDICSVPEFQKNGIFRPRC